MSMSRRWSAVSTSEIESAQPLKSHEDRRGASVFYFGGGLTKSYTPTRVPVQWALSYNLKNSIFDVFNIIYLNVSSVKTCKHTPPKYMQYEEQIVYIILCRVRANNVS